MFWTGCAPVRQLHILTPSPPNSSRKTIRVGASTFKSMSDVLGHQTLGVTGIYAKLDLSSLAKVALPWPGGAE